MCVFIYFYFLIIPPLRDGRVSENTVCLIRKLLVLDPQQRLTAGEVLESLSVIIASWWVLPLPAVRGVARVCTIEERTHWPVLWWGFCFNIIVVGCSWTGSRCRHWVDLCRWCRILTTRSITQNICKRWTSKEYCNSRVVHASTMVLWLPLVGETCYENIDSRKDEVLTWQPWRD